MKKSKALRWPIGIATAIILVFGFCVGTIVVTHTTNVQESDSYMTHYQDADAHINDLIKAERAFDIKYNVSFVPEKVTAENSILKYKISDKSGQVVKDAKLIVAISRPDTNEFKQKIDTSTFKDGLYLISGAKFPKPGIWNLVLKVEIGKDYKYYNVKIDTRNTKVKEF